MIWDRNKLEILHLTDADWSKDMPNIFLHGSSYLITKQELNRMTPITSVGVDHILPTSASSTAIQAGITTATDAAVNSIIMQTEPEQLQYWAMVLLIFPLVTVFGNVLVVLSVLREPSLHTATNYFIVSLAVADISLALVVMPMASWVEANHGRWRYGTKLCDIFIMFDVLLCTASILNLAAISMDRFVAVTKPIFYAQHSKNVRIGITIALTWLLSFLIALPIACGLNNLPHRNLEVCQMYPPDYIIASSIGSFYIPCTIMIILYYQVFNAIRSRTRRSTNISIHNPSKLTIKANNINDNDGDDNNNNNISRNNEKSISNNYEKPRNCLIYSNNTEIKRLENYYDTRTHNNNNNNNNNNNSNDDNNNNNYYTTIKTNICAGDNITTTNNNNNDSSVQNTSTIELGNDNDCDYNNENNNNNINNNNNNNNNGNINISEDECVILDTQFHNMSVGNNETNNVETEATVPSVSDTLLINNVNNSNNNNNNIGNNNIYVTHNDNNNNNNQVLKPINFQNEQDKKDTKPIEFKNMDDFRKHLRRRIKNAKRNSLSILTPTFTGLSSKQMYALNIDDTHQIKRKRNASLFKSLRIRHSMHTTTNTTTTTTNTTATTSSNNNANNNNVNINNNVELDNELKPSGSIYNKITDERFHKSPHITSCTVANSSHFKDNVAARREKKATKTLAIVLGVFLVCWMPFFTVNIIHAFCFKYSSMQYAKLCNMTESVTSISVWLGYINSFLNPIIYTIFNAEFRKAFKKLLRCRKVGFRL